MNQTFCKAVQSLAVIVLAATCAWSQGSHTFPTQASGSNFVAQVSASGAIGQIYLFGGAADTVCLDGRSGRVMWSVKAPGLSQQPGPGAEPILVGNTLVYMGGGGFFTAYGLDAETGHTRWSVNNPFVALAAGPDTLFLGSTRGLGIVAINVETGKVKWEQMAVSAGGAVTKAAYVEGRIYTNSPWVWDATTGSVATKLWVDPTALTARDGRVFVLGDNAALIALAGGTSKMLWEQKNPLPSPREDADDFVDASNRYVAVAFYDGSSFEAHHGTLKVYDAATGNLLWTKAITATTGLLPNPVSADDEFVYLIGPDSDKANTSVTVFNAKTGDQAWRFSAKRLKGPVAPLGDIVLISSDEGKAPNYTTLYALDQKTGVLRWKFSFLGPTTERTARHK